MNLLLDTHSLLWVARRNNLLTTVADRIIKPPADRLWFSVASL